MMELDTSAEVARRNGERKKKTKLEKMKRECGMKEEYEKGVNNSYINH